MVKNGLNILHPLFIQSVQGFNNKELFFQVKFNTRIPVYFQYVNLAKFYIHHKIDFATRFITTSTPIY